ncbi:hypothetical protein A3SI_05142 [Nitritalea halalkaliphila LW7]|uniref:Uncharacterized protein n=1 Tax=Nitritalea halalkaliphila LW7 TaxID=1189621 RepID=I5C863_9BACT|nr:hypothetical protein [Nitritalea halalkaliphila]EIM78015.1 hypothetical protein A3SI_05142 [Nitritalea halalkaliphila LW7]
MKRLLFIFMLVVGSCTIDNSVLEGLIEDLLVENQEVILEISALQERSEALITQLRANASERQALLERVMALQAEILKIVEEFTSLGVALNERGADIQAIQANMDGLLENYADIIRELQQLQQLGSLMAEIDSLHQALILTRRTQDNMWDAVANHAAETEKIRAALGFVDAEQQALEAQIRELTLSLGEDATRVEALIEAFSEIQEKLKRLTLIQEVMDAVSALRGDLREWEERHARILTEIETFQTNNMRLKSKLDENQEAFEAQLALLFDLLVAAQDEAMQLEEVSEQLAQLKLGCLQVITLLENFLNNLNFAVWEPLLEFDGFGDGGIPIALTPYSADRASSRIYFLNARERILGFFDYNTNELGAINVDRWPPFTLTGTPLFNPECGCVQFWENAQETLYEIKITGLEGTLQEYTPEELPEQSIREVNPIYDGVSKQPAYMNGFLGGERRMVTNQAFAFNTETMEWKEKRAPSQNEPLKRAGGFIFPNRDYTRAYIVDGFGNASGSADLPCADEETLPWSAESGNFCWHRDIWEIDLRDWSTRRLLPRNSNFEETGNFAYDYRRGVFYSFGGFNPSREADEEEFSQPTGTRKYDPRTEEDWEEIFTGGSPPARSNTFSCYYDERGDRFVVITGVGVFSVEIR